MSAGMGLCCLGLKNEFEIAVVNEPSVFIPNAIMSAGMGLCCLGLKNEFEIAVVNQPSVFEPL